MVTKSKTKIYYWLKFDKYFFDNLFIKRLLRDFPGGPEMIVIYIRLMLEAIDNDCIMSACNSFYDEEIMYIVPRVVKEDNTFGIYVKLRRL